MVARKIIVIDAERCDGCGLCASACHEGAIALVDGKARLVSDAHCDGLGACLGDCPRGAIRIEQREAVPYAGPESKWESKSESVLRNWPVQLTLVPPTAPWLQAADILLVADCVPFAMADFHRTLPAGKALLVGCPKLDDAAAYVDKLASIIRMATPRSITVARMEVPCCGGLVAIAKKAMAIVDADVPFAQIEVSLRGRILRVEPAAAPESITH